MTSIERRNEIKKLLITSKEPITGQELAFTYEVTRQVIVRDIAILRAEGIDIISTPKGYMILKEDHKNIRTIIAVNHNREEMENELKIIVKYGAIVEDVIVEHALYGEIRGMLMLKNMYDVENFCNSFRNYSVEPLSALTNGVHLHTIVCENEEMIESITKELSKKGFLVGH
ncbi:transcription repressor NadR [Clostridium culturomicium]|uniref:transcription repressor NadR n=1 Tax=Clostridium culturomicium TaxID=1499683 RepID=UPI00058F928A|nr:transcription repressor NadR [Clostridium culturomicium]